MWSVLIEVLLYIICCCFQSPKEALLWVDKYRPTTMKQIIGQQGDKSNAKKLLHWLRNWHKNVAAGKKPACEYGMRGGGLVGIVKLYTNHPDNKEIEATQRNYCIGSRIGTKMWLLAKNLPLPFLYLHAPCEQTMGRGQSDHRHRGLCGGGLFGIINK